MLDRHHTLLKHLECHETLDVFEIAQDPSAFVFGASSSSNPESKGLTTTTPGLRLTFEDFSVTTRFVCDVFKASSSDDVSIDNAKCVENGIDAANGYELERTLKHATDEIRTNMVCDMVEEDLFFSKFDEGYNAALEHVFGCNEDDSLFYDGKDSCSEFFSDSEADIGSELDEDDDESQTGQEEEVGPLNYLFYLFREEKQQGGAGGGGAGRKEGGGAGGGREGGGGDNTVRRNNTEVGTLNTSYVHAEKKEL